MKEIAIHCAYDELKSIAEVVPNPRNPNTHPEKQVKLLAKIIEAQGGGHQLLFQNEVAL